jgi:CheY-like chemotaxis protein
VGDKPAVRDLIKELGYEADVADKTPEAVTKGRASADFDWLLVHRGVADGDFLHVYSQLRQQYDLAVMPMVIVATKEREKTVQKLVGKDPGVLILPEEKFKAGDELKSLVENHIKNVQGMKLSADERKRMAKVSMDTLSRMAKGDYPGYNVMPALDVIVDQLRSPDNALDAIEILGRLPGKDIQQRLTAIVTNPAGDMKLRIPASIELNRHIHKNGLLVEKKAQDNIKTAHAEAEAGSPLRTQLTITMSTIDRPSAAKTGVDLTKFAPDAPAPKDPPKDKKDEK